MAPSADAFWVVAMLRRVLPVPGQLSESADTQTEAPSDAADKSKSCFRHCAPLRLLYPLLLDGMPCYFHSHGRPSRPAATAFVASPGHGLNSPSSSLDMLWTECVAEGTVPSRLSRPINREAWQTHYNHLNYLKIDFALAAVPSPHGLYCA